MIYNFYITVLQNNKEIKKHYYLAAENEKDFYKRCMDQYRADQSMIDIIEIISDDPNKTTKHTEVLKITKPKAYKDIASDMFKEHINGIDKDTIQIRKQKGWLYKQLTKQPYEEELAKYLHKYDKVKLYYLKTGARKNKIYVILYK